MGIDIYHGTGPVNWAKVKSSGHSFGIIKATEGISFRDTTTKKHLQAMEDAGMIRGLYHFLHVDLDPVKQANFFLQVVSATDFDTAKELPLVADIEDRSGLTRIGKDRMKENVEKFVSTVEAQTEGRKMLIYGDTDFLSKLDGGYSGHPLWLAQYTSDEQPHKLPTGWTQYVLWQYSESGRVAGISGNVVDLNRFNPAINGGGEAGLRAWIAAN